MQRYGLSEQEVRELFNREIGRTEASTSFYWESEEVEEALELIVDAVAKVIVANNKRIESEMRQRARQSELGGF